MRFQFVAFYCNMINVGKDVVRYFENAMEKI